MKNNLEHIIKLKNDANFFKELYKAYVGNQEDRTLIGKELAILHNNGAIDIVLEFRNLQKSAFEHKFFIIRHVFDDALPILNTSVIDIMECVKHLTLEAGNDLAANNTISSFILYCKANNNRPDEVLTHALANSEEDFDFITPAIIAGASFNIALFINKAIELTTHNNISIREKAVHVIGKINYVNNIDSINTALSALELAIKKEYKNSLFSSALKSVFLLYIADNSKEEKVVELIQFILIHRDDMILHTASNIINYNFDDIQETLLDIFLNALMDINIKNTGTIQNIDFCLESLLKKNREDKAINFIEKFLLGNQEKVSVTVFNSFIREVADNKHNQLYRLVTRWFLSKKIVLSRAAYELFSQRDSKDIRLKADLSQLKDEPSDVHVFLSKKVCGWFFMKPISAVSFILSLIDSASENEKLLMQNILFSPLLISYSGSVKDYLNEIEEESSDKIKETISYLLSELDIYNEGLKSVRNIM